MRARLTALVFLTVAVAVSGCGGGSRPETKMMLSADAICARHSIVRAGSEITVSPEGESLNVALSRVRIEQAALADLSRLTPPAAIAKDWRQFLAGRRALIGGLITLSEGDRANAGTLLEAVNATARSVLATARHAGFGVCSRLA
jgi:hypothetical protein